MRISPTIFLALVAASLMGAEAGAGAPALNEVIPLLEMDNVPLPSAIRQLARQAQLNILLDPKLAQPPWASLTVSVRWTDVTAREALVALLDNYGLALVEVRPPPAR